MVSPIIPLLSKMVVPQSIDLRLLVSEDVNGDFETQVSAKCWTQQFF